MSRVRDNSICASAFPRRRQVQPRRDFRSHQRGTIDWFLPWPQDALIGCRQVHRDFRWRATTMTRPSCRSTWVTARRDPGCKEYSDKFRRNVYVTPKSYLSTPGGYCALYAAKLSEVGLLADKINSGLSKLFTAKEDGHDED